MTYNAVNNLGEKLPRPGDAEASKGVSHEASLLQVVPPQDCLRCSSNAIDPLCSAEHAQSNVWNVQKDHGMLGIGCYHLPQESQVGHLHSKSNQLLAICRV